jgi:hypothetical protein
MCALVASGQLRAAESPVDFERHLMGLFGRLGCNSGSCHGSFQGKGGFRLSLFGYDPEKDYFALTRDVLSRRVNPVDPDRSLLLLKATGQVEHGGGRRFDVDTPAYRAFRDWITAGAPWRKGSGEVKSLRITPEEYAFTRPGEQGTLRVEARFADGSTEDITRLCDFRVNDDAVAEVNSIGQVKALQQGDTAVVVAYRGQVLPVRVLVPRAAPAGFVYPSLPQANYVDREVFSKLQRLNVVPSALADDAEFLRRLTIDTIGSLPAPDEVRAFMADRDPAKRAKKIDELLKNPAHAALWATKFSDITGNNTDQLENPQQTKARRSQMWHDWFRKRLTDNIPYDEIVKGVLTATTRDGVAPEEWIEKQKAQDTQLDKGFVAEYAAKPTLDLFWRRQQNVTIEQWGEKVAAAFLGIRLECAQCHKHPFDRWTQADYRAHANLFGQLAVGTSPEAKKVIDAENAERKKTAEKDKKKQQTQVREVYVGLSGKNSVLNHPDTGRPLPAKALGGPEIKFAKGEDPRALLFDWLKSTDNPYFARAFVNRVWGHYLGVGLVDPVDNFALGNPPSNPKLLDLLARDFIDHKFDIRHIERTILLSRTYQLSSTTNATNKLDRTNYSHSLVRPMMAEVVVDVLNAALGVTENFGPDAPAGSRAIEIGATRLQNSNVNYAFRIFGRPPRTAACDCERAMEPALPQTLYRMTDPAVQGKLQSGSRLLALLKSDKTDQAIFEDLFLATLSRLPTVKEREHFDRYRASRKDVIRVALPAEKADPADSGKKPAEANGNGKGKGKGKKQGDAGDKPMKPADTPQSTTARQAMFTDVLWALINTREFLLNH